MGGMGGASEWVDNHILFGSTANFGDTAGLYDAGCASAGQVYSAGAKWGALVAANAWMAGEGLAAVNRATAVSGTVTHFGPEGMSGLRPGDWVITGNGGWLNNVLTLKPFMNPESITTAVEQGSLRVPGGPLRRKLGTVGLLKKVV
jgi:hypothetical protein